MILEGNLAESLIKADTPSSWQVDLMGEPKNAKECMTALAIGAIIWRPGNYCCAKCASCPRRVSSEVNTMHLHSSLNLSFRGVFSTFCETLSNGPFYQFETIQLL